MENNDFTPKKIIDDNICCSIPLYQRLFEWKEEQIEKFLCDILSQYKKDKSLPYHIGMLTAYRNGDTLDLVDGQQRFTLITLMAIALGWKEFVVLPNSSDLRLTFFARPKDQLYLHDKINSSAPVAINRRMDNAINCITRFFLTESFESGDYRVAFENYIFNNLTFFIYTLPQSYTSDQLNKYFEAMNSAGRALENYEILKVDLLRQSAQKDRNNSIWNAVERMDKFVIKQNENEKLEDYRVRYTSEINRLIEDSAYANSIIESSSQDIVCKCIGDINPSPVKPDSTSYEVEGMRSIINFSNFLLLVLDIHLKEKGSYEFHRTDKLLETFCRLTNTEDIDVFYEQLLLYKLLFDFYVIKIQSERAQNSYNIEYGSDEEYEKGLKKSLIQFQSMLYVSTPHYNWLRNILVWIKNEHLSITPNTLMRELKKTDNQYRKNCVPDENFFHYGTIERYWFWRLDYYLWEKETKLESGDKNILNYTFRTNRSIEHLHPKDQEKNTIWTSEHINSFGNLAMISQSFNSSQSNDDIETKFGRIKSQINKQEIESIKMYLMYQFSEKEGYKWTEEKMLEHRQEMINLLKESFSPTDLL